MVFHSSSENITLKDRQRLFLLPNYKAWKAKN